MNKVKQLFNIKYPIIQGGMIWNSGYKLASAVSNCGGLGLIGAGSMYPDVFREHIQKCKKQTNNPFGVNLPLLYPDLEEIINIILEEKVKIVFTSGGSPKLYTETLKKEGIKVVHVVPSTKLAIKCQDAGVDAIVAEGFEAGGHNGRDETTTLCLIPNIKKHINIPIIAAGGIATGQQIKSVMMLGADGVQIGTRFAASVEASSHENFKQKIVDTKEGDTQLTLKELAPVRLIKNNFFEELESIYIKEGRNIDLLKEKLGKRRAKRGMFEGDLDNGELEVGQVSSLIDEILPVSVIFDNLIREFNEAGTPSL